MNLLDILNKRLKVNFRKTTGEANFNCPKCGHPRFYFNVKKHVGHCKRCEWSPKLPELLDSLRLLGARINDFEDYEPEHTAPIIISLPEGAHKLLDLSSPGLFQPHCQACKETVEHIYKKRKVPVSVQFQFNLHATFSYIYIPVYEKGILVNYVGRAKWWILPQPERRYSYCPGASTANYLSDWGSGQQANRLTLVENTFNAMWLGWTSTFGSHLSEVQAEKISRSRARSIAVVWDEGADVRAERAVNRLKALGVSAAYAKIPGEPEEHSERFLQNVSNETHSAALNGLEMVDFRG